MLLDPIRKELNNDPSNNRWPDVEVQALITENFIGTQVSSNGIKRVNMGGDI